jgi:hypothetical protein
MNKSAYTKIFLTLSFFILIGFKSKAQYQNNWALGLKVGEPLALNIRKYFSYGDRAFDLNIGSYGFLMGRVRNYRKDPLYDKTGIGIQGLYHYLNTIDVNLNIDTNIEFYKVNRGQIDIMAGHYLPK